MASRVIKKIIFIILTIFLSFTLFGCNNEKAINDNNENPGENINNEDEKETEKIEYIYSLLTNYYYSALNIDLENIKTVEELLTYTDPYTSIHTSGSTNIEKGESYYGLGISVTDNLEGLLISDVSDETDLYQRLFAGDIITKIDGTVLKSLSFEEKNSYLKKELNEELILTIKRINQEINLTVEIKEIPFPSITYAKYNQLGYLRINRFGSTTFEEFSNALEFLENENIEGLMIDVRDNGGGYLKTVYDILTLFIAGKEPLFYLYVPKQNKYEPYFPLEETIKKSYPITVLTNQNSASASEVLAATMRKEGYEIIGERTFGKDVYQVSHALPYPFRGKEVLNITTGYWLINEHESVSGGIYPDVFVYDNGINSLVYPVLKKEYTKGEINPYIGVYQFLVNLTVEGDYIPNFFNEDFMVMLKEYQRNNNLSQTGILDEATQKSLIIDYKEIKKTQTYDNILLETIKYMEKEINENR